MDLSLEPCRPLALLLLAATVAGCSGSTTPKEPWRDPRQASKVARIEIVPAWVDLAVGEQATLTAHAYDAAGAEVTDVRFAWSDTASLPAVVFVSPEAQEGKADHRFGAQAVVQGAVGGFGSGPVAVLADADGFQIGSVTGAATVSVWASGEVATLEVLPADSMSLAVGELRHVTATLLSAGNEPYPWTPVSFSVDGACLELLPQADPHEQVVSVRGTCEGTATVTISAPPITRTIAVTVVSASQLQARPPSDLACAEGAGSFEKARLLLDSEERPFVFYEGNGLKLMLARWAGTGWDVLRVHPFAFVHFPEALLALDAQGRPAFVASHRGHLTFFLYDPDTGRFVPEVVDGTDSMEIVVFGEQDGRPGYYPHPTTVTDGGLSALAFDRSGAARLAFERRVLVPVSSTAEDPSRRLMILATRTGAGQWTSEPIPFVQDGQSVQLPGKQGGYSWPKALHEPPLRLNDTADGLTLLSMLAGGGGWDGYLHVRSADGWKFWKAGSGESLAAAVDRQGNLHALWSSRYYQPPVGELTDLSAVLAATGFSAIGFDGDNRPHLFGSMHAWLSANGVWRAYTDTAAVAAMSAGGGLIEAYGPTCVVYRRSPLDYASPAVAVVPGIADQQSGFALTSFADGALGVLGGQIRHTWEIPEPTLSEVTFQTTRDGVHFSAPVSTGITPLNENHGRDLFVEAWSDDVYVLSGEAATSVSVSHDRGSTWTATYQAGCTHADGLAVDGDGGVWTFTHGSGDACGLRYSSDRGASFQTVAFPFDVAASTATAIGRVATGEILAATVNATTVKRSRRNPRDGDWQAVESVEAGAQEPSLHLGPFIQPDGTLYFYRLVYDGPEATRTFAMRLMRWAPGASAVEVADTALPSDDHYLQSFGARVVTLPSGTWLTHSFGSGTVNVRSELRKVDGVALGAPLSFDEGKRGGRETASAKSALRVGEIGGALQAFWIDDREAGTAQQQTNLYTAAVAAPLEDLH